MKYVHVVSEINTKSINSSLENAILNQADNCLYSLIGGLRQKNFGHATMENYTFELEKYIQKYLSNKIKYADSGGYSIIKGDIEPENIDDAINCYTTFFQYQHDLYDYIFSLDIPYSLIHTEMNKKKQIFEFNENALSQQLEAIKQDPSLSSKLYFVWHFKMPSLYNIWKEIVSKLGINSVIQKRAIGGMVSLRKMSNIDFSPFTGIAFRCFNDFLQSNFIDDGFYLHFLGINLPYDRMHIAFLEKLFNRLSDGCQVFHSYDSINFSQAARLRKDLQVHHLTDGGHLETYSLMKHIPDELIKKVYADQDVQKDINEELERRKNGNNILDINSFIPLNIYSELCLDRLFEKLIDDYQMVDTLIQANSTRVVESKFSVINQEIKNKYPNLFTNEMKINLVENMEYTWTYYNWFKNSRSDIILDNQIEKFTKLIEIEDLLT